MNSNSRIWALALMLSLMLNAFALGIWLGDKPRSHPRGPAHPAAEHHRAGPEAAEAAALFREFKASQHEQFRPLFKEVHKARQRARQALQAETYDAQALGQALADLRAAEAAVAAQAHGAIAAVAAEMDPAQRAQLSRLIGRGPGHGRAMWKGRHGEEAKPPRD